MQVKFEYTASLAGAELCFVLLQVPKYFELVQNFGPEKYLKYILCQSHTFCATSKDDFRSVDLFFSAGRKVFEEALNAITFLDWLKKFGPAQNILEPVEGHKCLAV